MNRLSKRIATAAILPLAAAASVTWASASTNVSPGAIQAEIQRLGPGTIAIDTSRDTTDFADSRLVTLSGTPANGGCQGPPLTLKLHVNEAPLAAIELAQNPKTCQQLVKIGHLRSVPVASGGAVKDPMVADAGAGATAAAAPAIVATIYGPRHGNFQTKWYDMVGIELNNVRVHLDWKWDRSRVTWCDGYGTKDWTWWTGWQLITYDGPHKVLQYGGESCRGYTGATFYNQPFCGGDYTEYWYNNVYGTRYGELAGDSNVWAHGPCAPTFFYRKFLWDGA